VSYGIFLLHVVLGLTVAAHGARKLFRVCGGDGLASTREAFAQLGFRAPALITPVAAVAEVSSGLMLAVGLLTPVATLVIAVVMLNAIVTAHWRNGFWSFRNGYEYPFVLWSAAVALGATGGMRFSLDRVLTWDDNISGLWWGVGVLAASLAISTTTLTLGRKPFPHLSAAADNQPAQRAA
jgi:putative oxidoreductase